MKYVNGIIKSEFINFPENLRRYGELKDECNRELNKFYEARKKAERKADKKYRDFVPY